MSGRSQELIPLSEETLCETLDAAVSIAISRPIKYGKNRGHRDRIDLLVCRKEGRIVFRFKFARGVVVFECFRERDRDEVKARVGWDSGEEINRLPDHPYQRRNFAGSQFLQCALLVDQNLFNLYAQPLEHDCSCQTGPTSGRPKVDSPATQIFERANVGLCQDVQLRDRETQKVANPVLQVRRLALGPEVFEHIGLRDGEINAPQIQQIVKVGGGPIRYHRQNAQIVAIVEDLGQFIGKTHVGAVDKPAGNAHGPGILAFSDGPFATTLLDEFWYRLCIRSIDPKQWDQRGDK